jgi:hypothetical protein
MPDPQLLTRGKVEGQAIANGANFDLLGDRGDARIWCDGDSTLVVEVDMTGTAAGDVTVTVTPYEADNVTPMGPAAFLPEVQKPATNPSLSGGHVYYYGQFDVTGVEMVRVRITNNNAAPQTITRASWRLA